MKVEHYPFRSGRSTRSIVPMHVRKSNIAAIATVTALLALAPGMGQANEIASSRDWETDNLDDGGMTYGEFFRERLAPSVIDYIVQTKHHNRRMPQAGTAEEIGELFVANYTVSHGFQTESPGQGSWQQGNDAHAGGQASTALGNAARALGQRSVAVGSGSVAIDDDTLSVGNVDMKRRITHVADGQSNNDAVNLGQFNRILDASRHEAAQQANRYTDQRVGELRKTVEQLDKTFRQGIASSAALQMVMPYAPGRVAVNAGTAMYRGQAAVAAGVSWWHPSGNVNFNGGISTAGGTSTILRAGIGYLF